MLRRPRTSRRWLAAAALISVIAGAAGACRSALDDRPVASLTSSPAMETRFDRLRARWIDETPAGRAALRPDLNALVIELDKADDGLEPMVRAYLAMSWLYSGVPAAAEAVTRPLIDGPPGVANDLATMVKGAAVRRLGRPREAIELLRPLIGKLIDPFARPILYEEISEAFLDEGRFEDAIAYAEGWLGSASAAEKKAVREAIARMLRRVPEQIALRVLEADATAPPEARHSPEMVMILSARVGEGSSAVATITDAGVADGAAAGADAIAPPEVPKSATVVASVLPIRFDPRTIALLVPTSAPGWGTAASAVVRAAAAVATPTLATALHGDAGLAGDATTPNLLGHRLAVLDTGGTPQGAVIAVDAAEREGAGVIIGGLTTADANALAALAQSRRIATVLLRKPTVVPKPAPGERQAWIAIGPTLAEEESSTLAARSGSGDIAVIAPWPEPGDTSEPSGDPLRARCDAAPKTAGSPAFPIAAWRARKVAVVVILGDARCAKKVADEIAASGTPPFRPTLVVAPSALELAHSPIALPRTIVGLGLLPADTDAPASLRTLWIDQGAPVGLFGALGHDAAALAASALPGDIPPTTETAALQKARVATIGRLLGARADLWTSTATSAPGGIVPPTPRVRMLAAGSAITPGWLPP